MPGFHPGIYSEHVDTGGRDPFFHFLKQGQPEGPWLWKVIGPGNPVLRENTQWIDGRCALHIHLHYYDQANDLLNTLAQLNVCPDLKISVTSKEGKQHVMEVLETLERLDADIRIVPNLGRDIGPFLTEFGRDLRKYAVIGHIHAKKSALLGDRLFVDRWVNFIRKNLLDGPGPMMDVILGHFALNPRLGLVFPDDPNIIGWTQNEVVAKSLAERMHLPLPLQSSINFPMGTMFWARPEALAPLFDMNLGWEDYPEEPIAYDGTMLHAIERLLPLITQHTGYECAVTNVPGVSR